MAFTEATLQAALNDSGADPAAEIVRFIPGPTVTDVYVQNNFDTRNKTGGWVQVGSTLTAAQAHTAIDAAMS
jgi:hypothetical protein